MNIKKKDIIKNISSEMNWPSKLSKSFLQEFLKKVTLNAKKGKMKISKFGTFEYKQTKERTGRNPKSGEIHIIKSRSKLNLIISNKVKKFLN